MNDKKISVGKLILGLLVKAGPLLILLVLVIFMSFTSKYFFSISNFLNIAQQVAVLSILAFGMTLVISGAGIDISVGSTVGFSGCIMAILSVQLGLNVYLAMILSLAASATIGAIIGFIIGKTVVPDFIVTLGMLSVVQGLSLILTDGKPIMNLPEQLTWLGSGTLFGLPVPLILIAIMGLLAWFILNCTRLGRNILASGGNRPAAFLSGINVMQVKVCTYAIMGLFAGVGGLILSGRINAANALVGSGLELRCIAAVILGGTALFGGEGTVFGTLIGAFIMAVLGNGLNLLNVSSFWQKFTIGIVIIAVVVSDQLNRRKLIEMSSSVK